MNDVKLMCNSKVTKMIYLFFFFNKETVTVVFSYIIFTLLKSKMYKTKRYMCEPN